VGGLKLIQIFILTGELKKNQTKESHRKKTEKTRQQQQQRGFGTKEKGRNVGREEGY